MSKLSEKEAIAVGMLMPFLLVGILAPLAILRAFVLTKLWNWYAVPFFALPHMIMVFAYGIALIVSFLTASTQYRKSESGLAHAFATAFLSPLFCLLLGWIGTFFI